MDIKSGLIGAGGTVVVAAGVFFAVAASNAAEPTVEPDVQQPIGRYSTIEAAVTVPAAPGLGDAYYLRTVKSLLSDHDHPPQSDAAYVQGGKDICAEIDNGATWETFAEQIAEYGLDYDFRRQVAGAAVISYCPQHAGIFG